MIEEELSKRDKESWGFTPTAKDGCMGYCEDPCGIGIGICCGIGIGIGIGSCCVGVEDAMGRACWRSS
jgi:hypothetical protein